MTARWLLAETVGQDFRPCSLRRQPRRPAFLICGLRRASDKQFYSTGTTMALDDDDDDQEDTAG